MSSTAAASSASTQAAFSVDGMNCASCVAHVEKAARKLAGVQSCRVNLARGRAVVQFDPVRTGTLEIADAISASGYPAAMESIDEPVAAAEASRNASRAAATAAWRRRALIGVALWFPVEMLHWIMLARDHGEMAGMAMHEWLDVLAFFAGTASIVYVGWAFYRNAWNGLRRGTTNMDTLIAMGATIAYGYSLVAWAGYLVHLWGYPRAIYFMEASGLLALISLGHWLEARARESAGSAIQQLLSLAPSTALRVEDDGSTTSIDLAQLAQGDRFLVRPGDRVAVDGVVIEGQSTIDESMITGEPLPANRNVGDSVIGGTLNIDGRLIVRATRVGRETALAQIVSMVETAQSAKPPVQQLADKIAGIFVPTVLLIALATGIGWYAYGVHAGWDAARIWAALANAVCSVVIIACPCALGLALPAALMVGSGMGARRGILIRDVEALQNAEKIDTVLLDKTGTVTLGKPAVVRILAADAAAENRALQLAASVEQFSAHPLAAAVVAEAKHRNLSLAMPDSFNSVAGRGVTARLEEMDIFVGNSALLAAHGASDGESPDSMKTAPGETIVHVSAKIDGQPSRCIGEIILRDQIKPDSAAAIARLQAMGLRVAMVTGDGKAAAESIAAQVKIDQVHAGILPDQKARVIERLRASGAARHIAMIGDGINDAPALAAADLGIAIGSGSDIAKEIGGIVLVSGSLMGAVSAILLSRATMRTIRRNLFFAFLYNVIAIPIAAFGLLNPLIAAGAMALSDVTVVGSALWLRRAKID